MKGELLLSVFSGVLEACTAEKMTVVFNNLQAKNPVAHKTVLLALYPALDVHLEPVVKKTKTKIDDSVLNGLKAAIEQSAELAGIELPNLDND